VYIPARKVCERETKRGLNDIVRRRSERSKIFRGRLCVAFFRPRETPSLFFGLLHTLGFSRFLTLYSFPKIYERKPGDFFNRNVRERRNGNDVESYLPRRGPRPYICRISNEHSSTSFLYVQCQLRTRSEEETTMRGSKVKAENLPQRDRFHDETRGHVRKTKREGKKKVFSIVQKRIRSLSKAIFFWVRVDERKSDLTFYPRTAPPPTLLFAHCSFAI